MDKEKKIDNYIITAENYIRSHPDTTGTTNAMIALTISIQQFDQTSSKLSTRLVVWTKILAVATIILAVATVALVVVNFT